MKATPLALALPLLVLAAGAQESLDAAAGRASAATAALASSPASPPASLPLRLRMDDPVVREAIRATLADAPAQPGKRDGTVLSGDPSYAGFARKMDDATVPSCLHGDAMKHQPPTIGPIVLGGLLALPFWGAAILRGKCR